MSIIAEHSVGLKRANRYNRELFEAFAVTGVFTIKDETRVRLGQPGNSDAPFGQVTQTARH